MEWRVIEFEYHNAYSNMAIDQAIFEGIVLGDSPPTIRFYGWSPSAVSIGRFQSLEDEVNIENCDMLDIDYVRRITGGGAVYHDKEGEITYSIIAPEKIFSKDIRNSYKEICELVVRGLANAGIKSEHVPINDIITNGKKISGNAQTRLKGVLMQHGTVLYSLDVKKMFSLLKVSKEKISDKMIKNVEERVTCASMQKKDISMDQLYRSLLSGFTYGKEYYFGKLNDTEKEKAKTYAKETYSTREWNFSR